MLFNCSNLTNLMLVITKLQSKTSGERITQHGFLDDNIFIISVCMLQCVIQYNKKHLNEFNLNWVKINN